MTEKNETKKKDWFDTGYREGTAFARLEADYDEVAAVHRAGAIPASWDLYRAEILNRFMGEKNFDFAAYSSGFARACSNFFDRI